MRLTTHLLLPLVLFVSGLLAACDASQDEASEAVPQPLVIREPASGLARDYARFRSRQVSEVRYDLKLSLSDVSEDFSGLLTMEFDLAPGNRSPVTLDFFDGTLLYVSVNGIPADFDYERWFISFAPELFVEGRNIIQISYSHPYSHDGAGLHHFTDPEDGEVYLFTQFEPYDANRLFPLFDQPDIKASWSLEVIAPEHWQVISNTRETRVEQQQDEKHWFFPESQKLPSYVFALHAGPYTQWLDDAGDIPLRLFARRSTAPYVNSDDWFDFTRQSFDFFQSWYDLPYPFGKYDQLIVPDFNFGAMENAAAVTYTERLLTRGTYSRNLRMEQAMVIAHEMAHMWFGDLVTMTWWNDLWLNESFATYMAYLALAEASEFEEAWDGFYTRMEVGAYTADDRITTHPIEQTVASSDEAFTLADAITYGKGGAVLKQLHFLLGDEAFRQGIRRYLKQHAWANTTLDDFMAALSREAGPDLGSWQEEWLRSSGVNSVEAEFVCEEDMVTHFRLLQSPPLQAAASQVLRTQRIQLAFYRQTDGGMVPTFSVPVTYAGASTEVPEALGQSCPDLVFPNMDDHAFVKIRLDPRSRQTLTEHISAIEDRTVRMMLWQSLWEEVREARAPLTQFTDFALLNLPAEQDGVIVSQVAGHLVSAWNLLASIDPQTHAATMAEIEAFMLESLASAEPGSQTQLSWYGALMATAHTRDVLGYLQSLLDGNEAIPGMAIDQDKRWAILHALNRHAYGDFAALLEAEADADPSDAGVNRYLAAVASRPDTEIKNQWVDLAINRPDAYKPATMRAAMNGLFPPEQFALQKPHQMPLIDAIDGLIARDNHVYLSAFVSGMNMATCDADSEKLLSDALARYEGAAANVEISLKQARENVQRCLAIAAALEAAP